MVLLNEVALKLPNFRVAETTLDLISTMMEADQGHSFNENLAGYLSQAPKPESRAGRLQNSLGMASLSQECQRKLWYGLRWASKSSHKAQLLRLFQRGDLEEFRFIALLKMIGCEVMFPDALGEGYILKGYKGHVTGRIDAVVKGIPEEPNDPMLAEFKTFNEANFRALKKKGLKKSKPVYFSQMQSYMFYGQLKFGIMMGVNKNTDELYAEIIELDLTYANELERRSEIIISSQSPPPKLSSDPAFFECGWCDHKEVCHQDKDIITSCRSCRYATLEDKGIWKCNLYDKDLNKQEQQLACKQYTKIS